MSKLIVMLILLSGQGGPARITGWSSIDACNAAKKDVAAFFKSRHGGTSYIDVETTCVAFPNK